MGNTNSSSSTGKTNFDNIQNQSRDKQHCCTVL